MALTCFFCFLLPDSEGSVSLHSLSKRRCVGSSLSLRFLGALGVFLITLSTLCLAAWALA